MKKLITFLILAIFAITGYSQTTTIKDSKAKRYVSIDTNSAMFVVPYKTVHIVGVEFTRPNNSAAYVANDVVGDGSVISFANVVDVAGGSADIYRAKLILSNVAGINRTYILHLFTLAPTAIADTAQMKFLYADATKRIGTVSFTTTTEGTGSDAAYATFYGSPLPFKCASGSKTIYGVLETKTAYTGAALTKYYVEISTR